MYIPKNLTHEKSVLLCTGSCIVCIIIPAVKFEFINRFFQLLCIYTLNQHHQTFWTYSFVFSVLLQFQLKLSYCRINTSPTQSKVINSKTKQETNLYCLINKSMYLLNHRKLPLPWVFFVDCCTASAVVELLQIISFLALVSWHFCLHDRLDDLYEALPMVVRLFSVYVRF